MGYGEFTRAAAGAPETQARLPALPKGRTSPQVTRQGRKSSLTRIPTSQAPRAGREPAAAVISIDGAW